MSVDTGGEPVLANGDSWYAAFEGQKLSLPLADARAPSPLLQTVHDQFRALVLSRGFPCVGAKSAFGRGSYRIGAHAALGSNDATATLERSLTAFVDEYGSEAPLFTTLIACFTGPAGASEDEFETLLWRQLQALHDRDAPRSPWSSAVSSDPNDPGFSFSFGGHAFFVVGLHAASSRWARRFAWPTLVFNRHDQFERLRADGRYAGLQRAIRSRDRALQGEHNPMLADFGARSEARQYSGRAVGDDWVCPFHAQTNARTEEGADDHVVSP